MVTQIGQASASAITAKARSLSDALFTIGPFYSNFVVFIWWSAFGHGLAE